MKNKIILVSLLISSLYCQVSNAQCVKSSANAPTPASGVCSPAKPPPDIPQGDFVLRGGQTDGGPQDGCFGGPPYIEQTEYEIFVGETLHINKMPGFYNSLLIDGAPMPFSFTSETLGEIKVPYLAANGLEWVTDGEIYITVIGKPLPITLLAFEGEALAAGNLLRWSTASEIENDYFRLEASADGIHFETINTHAGIGTVSDAQFYQYLHRQAASGQTYYRLSQTDFDGTTSIAGVLSVVRGEVTLQIIELRPNPAYEELLISFSSPAVGNVSLQIKDLMGRVLAYSNITSIGEMSYLEHRINLSDLAAGLYLLVLQSDEKVVRQKFIKR